MGLLWTYKHMPVFAERVIWQVMKRLPSSLLSMPAPYNVIVEPASGCNFRCPLCYQDTMKRKHGLMTYENFKGFVDDVKGFVKRISLDFAGEPTLNPRVFDMIKYAEENDIECLVMTNCSLLHRCIDNIFDSKLTTLYLALDGMTKATYQKYRVGGDFDQVKNSIIRLCKEKIKRKTTYPKLVLQFIVMKHNEHEVNKLLEFAQKNKINEVHLKSCGLTSETAKTTGGAKESLFELKELAKQYLPKNKKFLRYDKTFNPSKGKQSHICQWLLQSVILWNGGVVTCCVDYEGLQKIGNVFDGKTTFTDLWNSEKYKKIRKMILNRQLPLCKTCKHLRAGGFETVVKIN